MQRGIYPLTCQGFNPSLLMFLQSALMLMLFLGLRLLMKHLRLLIQRFALGLIIIQSSSSSFYRMKKNRTEAEELGLVEKKPVPAENPPKAVPPAAPPAVSAVK